MNNLNIKTGALELDALEQFLRRVNTCPQTFRQISLALDPIEPETLEHLRGAFFSSLVGVAAVRFEERKGRAAA